MKSFYALAECKFNLEDPQQIEIIKVSFFIFFYNFIQKPKYKKIRKFIFQNFTPKFNIIHYYNSYIYLYQIKKIN